MNGIVFSVVLFALLVWVPPVLCAPVGPDTVLQAASNWLGSPDNLLMQGRRGAPNAIQVTAQADAQGDTLYYVVSLSPGGFILVGADDAVEPVVAFSPTGTFDAGPDSPLADVARVDLAARLQASRQGTADGTGAAAAKLKWDRLLAAETRRSATLRQHSNTVSAVMVPQLTVTQWGQDKDTSGNYVYNLATPKAGSTNTLTGCVATAMAQLVYYAATHGNYGNVGVGTTAQPVTVCQQCDQSTEQSSECSTTTAPLHGGDGSGGAYAFDIMTAVPDDNTSSASRMAIAYLMADAGAASTMRYAVCGSSSFTWRAANGLATVFNFSNAVWNSGGPYGFSLSAQQYHNIIDANLDAGLPVIIGIKRSKGGHEVVVDGYGYNMYTPYHHINMGWDGAYDVWYNLPVIDTPSHAYYLVQDVVFNVYGSGTGEIVSGRVTDRNGTGLAGATVSIFPLSDLTNVRSTTTSTHGVYAFSKLPSNADYVLEVSYNGFTFANMFVTTGKSSSPTGDDSGNITDLQNNHCGNVWGVNFTSTNVFDSGVAARAVLLQLP